MTSRPFTIPLFASVLLHLAGLVLAARLVGLNGQTPPMEPIPIEVVTAEPMALTLPSRPQQEPPRPRPAQKITPPRLIARTPVLPPAQPPTEPPSPPVAQAPAEAPPLPKELPPSPRPSLAKEESAGIPHGNVLGPATTAGQAAVPSTSAAGGEAGAGKLFAKGDTAVIPGTGAGGGSGGPGESGLGFGVTNGGSKVTGLRLGVGPPRGGYQIKPRYPESARRQGIAGTSLLRLHVLADGTVGEILVEQSAGHQDLDGAAVEAVKRWRFEAARIGDEPVAMWVMLPVRFELR